MHAAASNGREDVVELLLQRPGINMNPRDKYLLTPFFLAVRNDLFEVVDLFLDCPTDVVEVDTMNQYGATAMHYCAKRGHVGA